MSERELKDRNKNPWYILMTLHGEQEGEEVDWELAEKNRQLWNAWICQGMDEETRIAAAKSSMVAVSETEWSEEKATEIDVRFAREWHKRNGEDPPPDLPDVGAMIDLSEIAFSNTVVLEKAIFRFAHFYTGTFTQDANFSRATFTQDAIFFRATFGAMADYRDATFRGLADFRGRNNVRDNASQPAHFGTTTLFSGAHYHKRADFFRRRFGPYDKSAKTLTFANAIFDGPVSFEEATFPDLMPVLTNTVLPESTKVTAKAANWPRLKPDRTGTLLRYLREGPETFANQDAEIVKASAGSLRHAMARQMLPEEEHFFFRREMWGVQRTVDGLRRLPVWFYGAVSDYGYSIGRPTLFLGALWLAGWIVYAQQTTFGLVKSAAYSFATMFKFFGLQGTYLSAEAEGLSAGLELWSGTQTVLAFILLFFLGLGLRTRFRLR